MYMYMYVHMYIYIYIVCIYICLYVCIRLQIPTEPLLHCAALGTRKKPNIYSHKGPIYALKRAHTYSQKSPICTLHTYSHTNVNGASSTLWCARYSKESSTYSLKREPTMYCQKSPILTLKRT